MADGVVQKLLTDDGDGVGLVARSTVPMKKSRSYGKSETGVSTASTMPWILGKEVDAQVRRLGYSTLLKMHALYCEGLRKTGRSSAFGKSGFYSSEECSRF